MYCVYIHTNKINSKMYIGVTNDTKRRWRQNGIEYKACKHFYEAIQKYGFDSFTHDILENNLTKEQAFEKEKYYINLYHSDDKSIGYNISQGGNGGLIYKEHPRNMLGKSQTDYQKVNQSNLMKNEKFNPMKNGACVWGVTHKHPKGMSNKKHTKQHNIDLSNKMKDMKVNCKAVRVEYPNGIIEKYDSMTDAQKIGLTKPVILKLIRSGEPYQIKIINQHTDKLKHLEGVKIFREHRDN